MSNVAQEPQSEPRLRREEWKLLEEDWLHTLVTDHSATERLYWFTKKGATDNPTLKFPAKDCAQAWLKLSEHIKNPEVPVDFVLDRAARLHQASLIESQIAALYEKQDELLTPLVSDLEGKSDEELRELAQALPSGFYRTEVYILINQRNLNHKPTIHIIE